MYLSAFSCALVALVQWTIVVHGCMPGQTELFLSNNNLDTFPDVTACESTLRLLDISNNAIFSIPSNISSLTALEELKVSGNPLSSLPDDIGYLWTLRVLEANDNNLDSLPNSFAGLFNLRTLLLARNHFNEVPSVILTMWNLEVLDLFQNGLAELPAGLGNLNNMRSANFGSNQIHSVPAEFGNWRNLNELQIDDNFVMCLPRSVKRLPGFVSGNYLPACSNSTATGYVMHRSRNHHRCDGPVRNTSGIAVGCIDYVRSSCVQTEDSVTVTKEYLSDLSSAGLSCDTSAPVVSATTDVYPRCDPDTGMATTCVDPEGADAPYPYRHPGMTTIKFSSFEQCQEDYENLLFDRRRLTQGILAASESKEVAITADLQAPIQATRNPEKFRLHPDLPAFKAAAQARAKQVEEEEKRRYSRDITATSVSPCMQSDFTGYASLYCPNWCNLAGCEDTLRELQIYGSDSLPYFSTQIPLLRNLEELTFIYVRCEDIPDNLDQLPRLSKLTISSLQGVCELPEVLRRMRSLTHFTYMGYWWGAEQLHLPWWFETLTQLEYLDFSYVNLQSWPAAFEKLVNLEHLVLNRAAVYSNPGPGLGRLTKLRTLDLRYTYISRLPASVGDLKELEVLDIFATRIQCLPQEVIDLPNLNKTSLAFRKACPEIALPVAFSQVRNNGCLWNDYFGFWYREICDAHNDKLTVILYADSACKKQAKRKLVHSLNARFPNLGYCMPDVMPGVITNGSSTTYSIQYCHH